MAVSSAAVRMASGLKFLRKRDLGAWAAMIFGLFWYIWRVDMVLPEPSTLWPTHLEWILHPDWDQHYLGWAFYRQTPMRWLPSRLPNLGVPGLGTTVGLMDANPWLCNLLRPISAWLPVPFQFIGPFMFLNFGLQGWFAAKVVGTWTRSPILRGLGGALIATSPVLLNRIGHDTLTAQWLILAMMWGILLPQIDALAPGTRPWRASMAALIVAAGLHPYLLAMVAPLWLLCLWRWLGPAPHLPRPAALGYAVAGALLVPLCAYGAGFLGTGASSHAEGFGGYSANLLTLVDAQGWSTLWPTLPSMSGQGEGFGFLGTGVWACVATACCCLWRHRLPSRLRTLWLGLFAVAALEAAFAVSDRFVVGRTLWLDLRPWTQPYLDSLSIFRASGRFVWPLHYVMALASIAAICRRMRRPWATATLFAALLFQVADTNSREHIVHQRHGPRIAALQDPLWLDLTGYAHLVAYPPVYQGHRIECGSPPYPVGSYVPLAQRALAAGLTFNSVSVARWPLAALQTYCSQLRHDVSAGIFAEDTVYVVHAQFAEPFLDASRVVACSRADGRYICVRRGRKTRLLAQIDARHASD